MKARFKLILGRRKNYPLNIELEVYKGVDCRVFIPTGVILDDRKQWDETRQLIVRHDYAASYNAMFRTLIKNIERAELEIENRGGVVTKDLIRKAAANKDSIDDINVIDKLIEYAYKEKLKESTITKYIVAINSLKRFVIKRKGGASGKLLFRDINFQLIDEFNKYISETQNHNTAGQTHLVIRKLLSKATREGYLKISPYENFDIKLTRPDKKPPLTKDQLKKLESLTWDDIANISRNPGCIRSYICVKDQFLFSCYTGLRISDSLSLLKSEFTRNANGLVLKKVMQKTGETVTLPLYLLFDGKPQEIAKKYLSMKNNSERLFPVSRASVRHLLETLFKKLGFPSTFTFHTARHTCASFLAEKVDNPFVIKDMLGHTDLTTSMIYIKTSHNYAEKKLKQVNWSLDGSEPERNMMEMCCELKDVCAEHGLNATQTMLITGTMMRNREKSELIKLWVESSNIACMSYDTLSESLHSLIAPNN